MQSIIVNKKALFVFHFYDTYLAIERKGEATQKIDYDKLKSCDLIKGKPQYWLLFLLALYQVLQEG